MDPSLCLNSFVGGSIPPWWPHGQPCLFCGLMGGPGCSAGPSTTTCDQRRCRHHFRAASEQPEIGQNLLFWFRQQKMPFCRTTTPKQPACWEVQDPPNVIHVPMRHTQMTILCLPHCHSQCRDTGRSDAMVTDFHGFVVCVGQGSSLRHAERILRRNSVLKHCTDCQQKCCVFVQSGIRFLMLLKMWKF